ncbi:tetratricopeptide repeat protein [Streptomyces xanthophaeus]|uniref:tetratricopeptide repeat protein n=1 Tax=Streptomyces xanthophaeus TaxID=67385 RepID=UPI003427DF89
MTDDTRPTPHAAVSNEITGGVFFHTVIQGRDITVQLPPQITPALSGLPASSPTFTGRNREVDALLQSLAPDQGDGKPALISAVAGLAGIGKTELVLQVANKALKRNGWFPGGALFTDMFGYDNERRLTPEHALDSMLRALGIAGEHIPDQLQDRARLYRSVLAAYAEQGKRILVTIDNASSADQAKPLLPSDGVNAALVTSRHTLDIGARLHDLDILGPDAAVDVVRQALQHSRGSNDTRVDDQPEQAKAVAELCGHLPLALQIVAALLAEAPTRPLASLAQDLSDVQHRLSELQREDKAVRSAFELSHQHLTADQARLFRLLSLTPGPDISSEAAAHLIGGVQQSTRRLLDGLARAHLIEHGRTWGRWRMHDLVRIYAEEEGHQRSIEDNRDAALRALCMHYQIGAGNAFEHLSALPGRPVPERFRDREDALAWLEAERLNLTAIALNGPSFGNPGIGISLAFTLSKFFTLRGYTDDFIAVEESAVHSLRQIGDPRGLSWALDLLGSALRDARRLDESINAHKESLMWHITIGNREGEATAEYNLGLTLQFAHQWNDAIGHFTNALTITHEVGDLQGQASALTGLGAALSEVGRFSDAINALSQAMAIDREVGNRHGEAFALGNLGIALRRDERPDEAIEALRRAATLFRELGDHKNEYLARWSILAEGGSGEL